MTTSGTIGSTVFETRKVIEAVFRRCKIPPQGITPEKVENAKDQLYLFLSALPTRVIPLWAQDRQELSLVEGVATVSTPAGTIDVMNANLKTGTGITAVSVPLARVSLDSYAALTNRATQGRPIQYWLDRQASVPILNIWPTPDATYASSVIEIWRQRNIMDVGSLTQTLEFPARWYEAVVAGLAWRVLLDTPDAQADPAMLKGLADEAMALACADERDNSPIVLTASIAAYTR